MSQVWLRDVDILGAPCMRASQVFFNHHACRLLVRIVLCVHVALVLCCSLPPAFAVCLVRFESGSFLSHLYSFSY